jgi:capsular exopolysaccharide synthesis family protein
VPENAESQQPGSAPSEDLNLNELIRVAYSHLGLIGWTTGLFLAGAALYAFLWPPTYEAATTVKVPDVSQTAQGMLRQLVPTSSGDPVETYAQICKSETVAAAVTKALDLTSRPEFHGLSSQRLTGTLLKSVISVSNVLKTNIISITARSRDPRLAADLANTWAQAFLQTNLDLSHKGAESKAEFLDEQVRQLRDKLSNPDLRLNDESKANQLIYAQLLQDLQQAHLEEKINDAGIVVVDQAEVPEKPVSPKKSRALALALLLGLAAGLQLAFLLERLQDRVKQEDQVVRATGLAVLTVVPDYMEEWPAGFAAPLPGERFTPKVLIQNKVFLRAYYRESFKILRTNLTYAQADKSLKALAVLSAGPGEGKTLVNANLAVSLAQAGKRTLLVDADFRKPSVRKIFDLENGSETGLPTALIGQKPWRDMVRPSGVEHLDLLPNTVSPPNPAELLGSEAMRRLVGEFKAAYDFVVFDGAPILPVTDSVILSTLLDGVVLLARSGQTRIHDLGKTLVSLRAVGAPVLGAVLNYYQRHKSLYGYGYGYGYGNYHYGSPEEDGKGKKS